VEPLGEDGLWFVVCKVEKSLVHRKIPRPDLDTFETKYRFVRYLERAEGKPFFKGRA
jgi:hypothetical protein